MKLASYISDLLYRYECVIIPEFGGFVTTLKPTIFNPKNNTFYPPSKAISFNANLVHNDGLLANYMAKVEKCSYTEATNKIKNILASWQKDLHSNNIIELDKIGSFTQNPEGKIIFDPQGSTNYLTDSYGLSPLIASKVAKDNAPVTLVNHQVRPYLKYAAVFVLGLSTIGFGNRFYQNYRTNQQVQFAQAQQKAVESKIQSATFTISNPLPSITLHNTYISNNFYVVAGAFREPLNAKKKLRELKNKGFDAAIIGKNKWQLTQVAFGSYATKKEATKQLYKIRATYEKDAWLLVKK
ncbi:MAG: SPOR domain-containing protein [Flavobacteriaceae bacterium]|nr:SPOR domain-containing protein [Flavobacteriaceae bacterium]